MGEESKENNLARRVERAVRATVPLIITAIACGSDGKEQPSITPKIEQSIFQEGKIRKEIEEKFGKTINSDFFNQLLYWQTISKAQSKDLFVIYAGESKEKRTNAQVLSWKDMMLFAD